MMKCFLIFMGLLLQLSVGFAAEEIVNIVNIENIEKPIVSREPAVKTESALVLKSEDQIPLNIDQTKSMADATPAPTRLILTGIILSALLGTAYYFVKKYKVSNKINKSNMQIKVLSQHFLGPKKSLAIVRVAGESILIGVTDSNISMIKSLSLIDDEVPSEIPPNFADALNSEKATSTQRAHTAAVNLGLESEELEEEFSFSGLKETVSKKLKSMRSI